MVVDEAEMSNADTVQDKGCNTKKVAKIRTIPVPRTRRVSCR